MSREKNGTAIRWRMPTPVLKKSKDPTVLDNYCGITELTPIIAKLFEIFTCATSKTL